MADRIIVQTNVGAQEFPSFSQNKISVISNYRPAPPLTDCDKSTSNNHLIRFVNIGGITKEKGIDLLLSAFHSLQKTLPDPTSVEMHLFGASTPDMVQQIEKVVSVYYHGKADNDMLRRRLDTYDIFVFPSVYSNEGHPGAIIEALMAGLPVIASDLPGCREVINNNVNGMLFAAGNIEQLAEKMKILATDHMLRRRLSQEALLSGESYNAEHVLPLLAAAVGLKV